MRKLSTKEIVLLIALVFIVSAALYYNYFFTPYQQKIIDLNFQISTSQQRYMTLQNQQQSIIKDTEKLNAQLEDIKDEFSKVPQGIDEPNMLVFFEETLNGKANNVTIRFSPETTQNEYYQTSKVLMSFYTTYPNLETILDTFYNSKFSNRITGINMTYEEPEVMLGPQLPTPEGAEETVQEEEPEMYYLHTEITMDCYTIPAFVNTTDYPFMIGPYNNANPFEVFPEVAEETPAE